MLFDVVVIHKLCGAAATFLPFKETVKLAKAVGLFHAAPLLKGSLAECAAHPVKFVSTIHRRLARLAPEPAGRGVGAEVSAVETDNMAEGIVVRSWDAAASVGSGDRPIMKIKSPNFSEGAGAPPPPHGSNDSTMSSWLLELVNGPRVAAAASKIGDASRDLALRPAVVDEVLRDIAEEVGGDDQPFFVAVHDELRCKAFDILAATATYE